MKAVILAGGLGTRLSEETYLKPKPMVEIGGKPILWHIMKIYSSYGINEFVICCGYKGYVIKEYFSNYFLHTSDITFDLSKNHLEVHHQFAEPWKVTLVDTGAHTMTGGRLLRVREYVEHEECFCFTYGDGLTDANISETIKFHKSHGKLATMLATKPSGRYGAIKINSENIVSSFQEKVVENTAWVNGGFFVLSPAVFDKLTNDETVWEEEPLNSLASENQLVAYRHDHFWQPMDTLKEKSLLNSLWEGGNAPWKKWDL